MILKYFLESWVKKGFLIRLKRGLYSFKPELSSEAEIANRLYQPSYLSFEYALAYYNILPEMPYVVTSATTKVTRIFSVESKTFSYLKIKKEAYGGYFLVKERKRSFLIAEPEKALVDYFYFMALGKKPFNDRLVFDHLDKEKILKYAQLYNRKKLNKLVKSQT